LIITTPGLGECISGVILYDETILQARADGTPFVKIIADSGIVPGIKVDTGAKDLAGHAGEKNIEGLDGQRERLRRQRACARPLRRPLSGGRLRSDRRAGGAHGRRSYDRSMS
jgi:fructose-bisphosphate aldolase class 1